MARVGKAERIYGDVYSLVHYPPFPKGDGVIFFMSDEIQSLTVGDRTFVPSFLADGKSFCFSDNQIQFLLAHQKTKNLEMAAQICGKDADWAKRFIGSKKFRQYVASKMNEFSVKNGLTVEWWYQFGKAVMDGKVERFGYECKECGFSGAFNSYEVESSRDDEMVMHVECQACYKPVVPMLQREAVIVTREQMEAWKEIGQRIIPKIERVHHQFEKSEFVFESEESA